MKRTIALLVLSALFLTLIAGPMPAQTEFKNELVEKHGLSKLTSCYTCHLRKSEVDEKDLPAFMESSRSFRDDFGKAIEKHFKGKDISARLKEAKDHDDQKTIDEIIKDFRQALEKAEAEKNADGATYGELIKSGKLDGIKLAGE